MTNMIPLRLSSVSTPCMPEATPGALENALALGPLHLWFCLPFISLGISQAPFLISFRSQPTYLLSLSQGDFLWCSTHFSKMTFPSRGLHVFPSFCLLFLVCILISLACYFFHLFIIGLLQVKQKLLDLELFVFLLLYPYTQGKYLPHSRYSINAH